MTTSPTTIYGTTAASLLAAGQIPAFPPWLTMTLHVLAAVSLGLLGYHAADCPPNCPGTDQDGYRREDPRQRKLPITFLLLLILAAFPLAGCVTHNPNPPTTPPTEPAYVVNPSLPALSNAAVNLARELGDLSQTGPLLPIATTGVLTLVGAITAMVLQHKNHRDQVAALRGPPTRPANSPVDTPPSRA